MRTTLTIDDVIARQRKDIAHQSGRPFTAVVDDVLRAGLEDGRIAGVASPYRMEPVAMGGVAGHHHLGKTLRMAEQLEDQELARKFQRRK